MTLKSRLRAAANRVLHPCHLSLERFPPPPPVGSHWTMDAALARLAKLGLQPATMIDVGAARGEWTILAQSHFPRARSLLIEPLAEHRTTLARVASAGPGGFVVTAVAGDHPGSVAFNVTPDLDGSGVYGPDGGGSLRTVEQVTIDGLIDAHQLPPPYILKLDTHGFELPIFAGAASTLQRTEALIVEAYGFRPSPTAVRFWELCAWLAERGFRAADWVDSVARPDDGLLWQADLVFLRADHPAFARNTYQ
jgi:FkbM family methyltransferase